MPKEAQLYQRLRTEGYPWKQINPRTMKVDPNAFKFGVRFTVGGKQRMKSFEILDDAVLFHKQQNVRFAAEANDLAVAVADIPDKTPLPEAVRKYFANVG